MRRMQRARSENDFFRSLHGELFRTIVYPRDILETDSFSAIEEDLGYSGFGEQMIVWP